MQWPEVFTNPSFSLSGKCQAEVVAMGLIGWAYCKMGNKPPGTFGDGMVKIGEVIGCTAIEDNLHRLADEFLKDN